MIEAHGPTHTHDAKVKGKKLYLCRNRAQLADTNIYYWPK